MKKIKKIFTVTLIVLLLTACSNKKDDIEIPKFSIISPSGSAGLSLLGVIDNQMLDIEFVDGADLLISSFTSGDKDLIIAPINVGYKLASKTNNYKMLGIMTWGNLFYYSKVNNPNKIAVFGESSIPGIITKLVKDYLPSDAEFIWFNSTQEVAQAFLSGSYDACVVAEPVATKVRSVFADQLIEIDIQKCYSDLNGFTDAYPMSALFVRNDVLNDNKETIESLFDIIMMTSNTYNLTKAIVADRLREIDIKEFGFDDEQLIIDSYVNMKIEPEYARNYVSDIEKILKYNNIELDNKLIIK